MTEEETEMLRESHRMSKELHDAFLRVPLGAPKDEKPLLTELRDMNRRNKNLSWAGRMTAITLPAMIPVLIFYRDIGRAIGDVARSIGRSLGGG